MKASRREDTPDPETCEITDLFADVQSNGHATSGAENQLHHAQGDTEAYDVLGDDQHTAFEVDGGHSIDFPDPLTTPRDLTSAAKSRRKPVPAFDPDDPATLRRAELADSDDVSQIWSRWAEWGSSILWIMLVFFVGAYGGFGLLQAGSPLIGAVLFGVASLLSLILTYPLIITLERPVRMAPEQTLRDFYGALSHMRPHYKRMWLLLSDPGKTSIPPGDRPSKRLFKSAWHRFRSEVHHRTGASPNRFAVKDFSAEPGKGRSRVECKFNLVVSRGHRVLETHSMTVTLVRGRDRMWYLDHAAPPAGAPAGLQTNGRKKAANLS